MSRIALVASTWLTGVGCADKSAPAPSPASSSSAKAVATTSALAFRSSASGDFSARGSAHHARVRTSGGFAVSAPDDVARELGIVNDEAPLGKAASTADGAVTFAHQTYVERLENRAEGVEQTWIFAAAPPGADDVRMSLSTFGLSYRGRTATGLHFGDPRGALQSGVRYGDGTWVDANGARTRIPATWMGDRIALTVPRALLASSAYPATLDPLVGPENDIDAPAVAPATTEERPTVGASNNAFYVAWIDARRRGISIPEQTADLYGARLDPMTGLPLAPSSADGTGALLFSELFFYPAIESIVPIQSPVIASSGDDFLVAIDAGGGIIAVPVSGTTGVPLPALLVAVTDPQVGGRTRMSATYGGGMYIIGWSDGSSAYFARITAAGALLDSGGVPIAPVVGDQQVDVVVSCDPANSVSCLATWLDTSTSATHAVRFDPATLTVLAADTSGPALPLPLASILEAAVYDPVVHSYALAYEAPANGNVPPRTYGNLYNPANGLLSLSTPALVSKDAVAEFYLTYDGSRLVAGWPAISTTNAKRAEIKITTLDATTLASSTTKGTLALDDATPEDLGVGSLASIAGRSLVASYTNYEVNGVSQFVSRGARVDDASGTSLDPSIGYPLVGQTNAETLPAIASNGTGALLAWNDDRANGGVIVAQLLDAEGEASKTVSEEILSADAVGGASGAAVASDGTDYLVVWSESSPTSLAQEIDGVRIDGTTGAVLGHLSPIPCDDGLASPAVVFDGTAYAVAVAVGTEVTFARVDAQSLRAIAPPAVLRPSAENASQLSETALAYGDGVFFVAWASLSPSITHFAGSIMGARFDATGKVFAEDGAGVLLSASSLSEISPAVAYGGGTFFAVWEDARGGGDAESIYGRAVSPRATDSLAPTAPDIAIASSLGASQQSAVLGPALVDAGDGLSFEAVWSAVDGVTSGLVSYAGVPREPGGLPVVTGAPAALRPAVARVGAGAMLVAYARTDASTGGSYHVYTRALATGPTSGACKIADDCASRYCVDGVCCDAPCDDACRTCNASKATSGKCTNVTSGTDPDSCKGGKSCSSAGVCGAVDGTACAGDTDCASGFCVDGLCCESACGDGCDVCNAVPGKCTVVAAGSTGVMPPCAPALCDGTHASCPTTCTSDDGCERPYTCAVGGTCKLLSGATCASHDTLTTATGAAESCRPYACVATACATTCRSIEDCGTGFLCDAANHCVEAANARSDDGCASAASSDERAPWAAGFGFGAVAMTLRRRRRNRRAGKRAS